MATTVDFIEYVCEQISGVGNIRYRKMFGEYMVYVNDKPIKKLDCIADKSVKQTRAFPIQVQKSIIFWISRTPVLAAKLLQC